jgi:hypothetical protein
MPSFAGRFQIINRDDTTGQAAACRASFDTERMTLTPAVGTPLDFDLGDIDGFHAADYELTLDLYTGQAIVLGQFGKAFQNLCHDLLAAWRDRVVHCLLLEDMEELARVEGFASLDSAERRLAQAAEVRLYRSNLAVLPASATGLHWRLADIDAVDFDTNNYALTIRSGTDRLIISKLARRTDEFRERLSDAMTAFSEQSTAAVQHLFPFLSPEELQRATEMLKEGRSAPLSALAGIHRRIEQALVENAIDADLRPYFEFLKEQSAAEGIYTGFKLIWKEAGPAGGGAAPSGARAEAAAAEAAATEEPDALVEVPEPDAPVEDEMRGEVLHWFFFPLRTESAPGAGASVVAWEATSRSGRATYCFRVPPAEEAARSQREGQASFRVDAAVRRLNRGIALLNFRREPIYLPDDALELEPRFRRYAIAARKIPVLRELRTQFLGRALHITPEAWKKQLQALLAKA